MAQLNIPIKDPSTLTTPTTGTVTFFLDSTSSPANILSYMDDTRTVHIYTSSNALGIIDDCVCDMAKDFWCKTSTALMNGIVTPADIVTLATPGIQWVETVDPITGAVAVQFKAVP